MSSPGKDRLKIFRQMYETNVSLLVRFAQRFTPSDAAEDIVQDVFVELWKIEEFPETDYLQSYLFKAVRNRCINYLKQKQTQNLYVEKSVTEMMQRGLEYFNTVEKVIIREEELQLIYDHIELLPDKCRQIFKLSYFEDKKSNEIAELLQLSVRTVEHQLYLGLKILRKNLQHK